MALVLDTGPLLAALDAADEAHDRCVALLRDRREDLVVPAPVLGELDYFVRKYLGVDAWSSFVADVAEGAYRLHQLDEPLLVRAAELERTYDSARLGLVDAAVIATCERLGETKVATLDVRHFAIVRPRHCDALRLLPD